MRTGLGAKTCLQKPGNLGNLVTRNLAFQLKYMISELSILLIYIVIRNRLFQWPQACIEMIKKFRNPNGKFIRIHKFSAFFLYLTQSLTENLFWLPETLTFLESYASTGVWECKILQSTPMLDQSVAIYLLPSLWLKMLQYLVHRGRKNKAPSAQKKIKDNVMCLITF